MQPEVAEMLQMQFGTWLQIIGINATRRQAWREPRSSVPKLPRRSQPRNLPVHARHKIISHGQDHLMALDPQTSAACPRTSPGVQFSLEIRILHRGIFRWTNPNGGQNGGQTHSQAK
jgi:hypothetical protein